MFYLENFRMEALNHGAKKCGAMEMILLSLIPLILLTFRTFEKPFIGFSCVVLFLLSLERERKS